jgi:hypothetical protein
MFLCIKNKRANSDIENRILNSINLSKYDMRTIEGIAKELTETPYEIAKTIRNLMHSKEIIEITDWNSNWYYTTLKKYNKTHSLLDRFISEITGIPRY